MARYLVTGGAGFIGSHLIHAILKQGDKVIAFDNLCNGSLDNIEKAAEGFPKEQCFFMQGDIRDLAACQKACEGVDYVLHQAALGSITRSIDNPVLTHDNNTSGTLNMLIAARDAKIKRFVYASSSSVYGASPVLPRIETDLPQPISPYAASKLAGEGYAVAFYRTYDLETVSLRYFNVFGPRQNTQSQYAAVLPRFLDALLRNQRPVIYGDGNQARDFTFVENVVSANLLSVRAPREACGKVFNVACGEQYSINHLYGEIQKILGVDRQPERLDARPGDVRESRADISLAKKLLGYTPSISFAEGLRATIKAYVESYRSTK